MKTTFSYFPGMFENPAPAKYYWVIFNNFLLIDTTDKSKIKSAFFALGLYLLSFFVNTSFKCYSVPKTLLIIKSSLALYLELFYSDITDIKIWDFANFLFKLLDGFPKKRNILGGNTSILFNFNVKWIHSNKQKDGQKLNTYLEKRWV